MKVFYRFCSLFLTVVMLLGLFPTTVLGAGSSTLKGLPEADMEELVVEYGKPVSITLARLKKMIYTNNKSTTISSIAGVLLTGTSHGKVLTAAPSGMGCTADGNTMPTTYGTLSRTSGNLSYTPSGFLSEVDTFYVVIALSGCKDTDGTTYTHIVIQVRLIPATSMYYEAEDYLGNGITAFDTTNGGTTASPWTIEDDKTGSGNQSQTANTTDSVFRDMVINRENIPAGAFFADFTNTTDDQSYRYKKDLIYGGYNFDTTDCWSGNETDTIDTNSGTLTLTFKSGKTYHYGQTVTSKGNLSTKPLAIRPGSNDVFQIRFRIENCSKATSPTMTLCYLWNSDDGADTTDSNTIQETEIDAGELNAGHYITVTIPLNKASYKEATKIDYFRFTLGGVPYTSSSAKMIIDYVYFGPKTGLMLPKVATGNYLFFGFDQTSADARFSKSIYGSTSSNTINYNNASNWSVDTDCTATESIHASAAPGYLKFVDNADWSQSNGLYYCYFQTGSSVSTHKLAYSPTNTDIFRIRFKIEGGEQLSSNSTFSGECRVRLEAGITGTTGSNLNIDYGYKKFDLASAQKDYIIVDISVNNTYKALVDKKKITSLRPVFYNVDGKGEATFYIDYIYLGPKEYADIVTKTDNYFFLDFTNTTADKDRFDHRTYGYNVAFDTESGVSCHSNVTPKRASNCMTLTPTSDYTGNIYFYAKNLKFVPAGITQYFQMRFKLQQIDSSVPIASNGTPNAGVQYKVGSTTYWKTQNITIPAVNEWVTVTLKMSDATFTDASVITQLAPAIRGIKGAKVIIDYVYLGSPVWSSLDATPDPTSTARPATESLYFGFEGASSRYAGSTYSFNNAYGYHKFDTASKGYWATSDKYSDSTKAFTINNALGIMSVNCSKEKPESGTKGPYIATTNTYGTYSFSSTNASLGYCPQKAEVFQIRLRLNGCTVTGSTKPEMIFLFGGYDESGGAGGEDADYGYVTYSNKTKYPYAKSKFEDSNSFQVISIPLSADIRNLSMMTNFGIRFWYLQGGKIEIDYIYIGPGSTAPEPVYGNDTSYDNDIKYSNGKSLFVHGTGVKTEFTPNVYSEASFTFKGTGFDLISRTGSEQGAIRVEVRKTSDNSLVKSMTVNNKGATELYQIPVVSVTGLDHGEYKVTLWVNKKVESDYDFLYRGDEFYLDAIRIYDPINVKGASLTTSQSQALNAYKYHKESFTYVREIRDTLLSAADFNSSNFTYATNNSLLVDAKPLTGDDQEYASDVQISGNLALTVGTYNQVGPKNEVYLSPGQAVAFKLELATDQVPVSIDIGAKAIQGDSSKSAILAAGLVTSASSSTLTANTKTLKTITSGTAMYYPLDISSLTKGTTVHLILHNQSTATGILSLTDLKICYATSPTGQPSDDNDKEIFTSALADASGAKRTGGAEATAEPFRFAVDDQTIEAAAVFLNSLYETPVVPEEIPERDIPIYHSLNLASDISVNFLVPMAELEDCDNIYMTLTTELYDKAGNPGYTSATLEPEVKGGYYYFTLSDLNAVRMNDRIDAVIHFTQDGTEYSTPTDFYSIAEYAYAQLDKENVPDTLKTLCADLLVYGAKAQLYKGYRTDALADSALTEEQRAYCSDLDAVAFGSTNVTGTEQEAPVITWVGKALELNSKVTVIYRVDLSAYEGEPSDLTMKVTYLNHKGEETTVTLTDPTPYEARENCYSFYLDSLLAAELRTVLTAQVYEGDTPVSNTLTYSPDTYGNNKPGDLGILCRALFAYSDSAKAYFDSAKAYFETK